LRMVVLSISIQKKVLKTWFSELLQVTFNL
jgi:hypothetical protein